MNADRPGTPVLATERLTMRPLQLADAAQVQPLFARWQTVRLLAARVPWPYPEDGAFSFYRDVALPAMERREEWIWTLRLKTAPEQTIGSLGLSLAAENRGFWLGEPWQGRGLMSEAVEAANAFWFEVLGMTVLRTVKAMENTGSRGVSERTGGRVVGNGEMQFVSGWLPYEVWELTAEDWRARRSAKLTR